MRLSDAEYQRLITGGQEAVITEAAFQAAIRRLAQQYGWMYFHVHSSKHSPEGYPDVTLARGGSPLILAELKTMAGVVTKPQEAWLEAIAGSTGVVGCLWRPTDLEAIVAMLRQEREH